MSNSQKTPLSRSITKLVETRIWAALAQMGIAYPGTVDSVDGAIVTINFDVRGLTLPTVKMPLAGSEYVRLPIQKGDPGYAVPADATLGYASGLSDQHPDTRRPANLEALVWFPIGNANWDDVDSQAVTIYGPNGVVLRDSDSKTTFTLTPDGLEVDAQTSISLKVGSMELKITESGITIAGKDFITHTHAGNPPGTYTAPGGGGPVSGHSGPVS